jgi:hypothetical protein
MDSDSMELRVCFIRIMVLEREYSYPTIEVIS